MRTIVATVLMLACGGNAACEKEAAKEAAPSGAWLKDVSAFCSVHPRAPGEESHVSPVTVIATAADGVELTSASVKRSEVKPDAPNDVNKPPRYVFRIVKRGLCAESTVEVTFAGTDTKTGEKVSGARRVSIGKVN